jgi:hypothetical protein
VVTGLFPAVSFLADNFFMRAKAHHLVGAPQEASCIFQSTLEQDL